MESAIDIEAVEQNITTVEDYDTYKFSPSELLKYLAVCGAGMAALGYVFYRNLVLSLIFAAVSIFFLKFIKKGLIRKRKRELMLQFRDALTSLSTALGSGTVIESAIEESISDLRMMYPYENVMIINEFAAIVNKKRNGESIESALTDFAERAKLGCITDFVDVFVACNRTGGNNMEIIRSSSGMISDKIEIENDIAVLVSGKKFEQRILTVAPIGFIWLLSLMSGEYLAPMFNSLQGHLMMTGVLMVIVASFFISNKIMNIEL